MCLAISTRQASALFKAAQKERGIVEIDPETGIVTLIPEVYAIKRVGLSPTSKSSLEAWKQAKAGKVYRPDT